MKKLIFILVGILLAPIIAYIVSLVTEARLGTFVSAKILLIMVIIAVAAVVILHFAIRLPKFWAGAIVIGILISPYFQFLFGKINIFLTDPPNLRASVSVPEIRVEMGDLIFINNEGGEVVALAGGGVNTLYPGKNIVNLGQLNLPAGNYKSGRISIKNVEVDIGVDLAKEVNLVYGELADILSMIPSDIPAEAAVLIPGEADMKKRIAEEMEKIISKEMIIPYLPSFVRLKSFDRSGNSIAIVIQAQIADIAIPAAFPYPTGAGGPDIILDITLNEIGLPTGIAPIIKLPPGAPAITIPDLAPDFGGMGIPTDFGIPESVLEQIKSEIRAGISQGQALKAAAEGVQ
ncbi:MAG: hypothetical protein PHQ42_00595 [Patescibacteria group bacterium]|nr:hypothetical protein [Patescibacteria group bacterium]